MERPRHTAEYPFEVSIQNFKANPVSQVQLTEADKLSLTKAGAPQVSMVEGSQALEAKDKGVTTGTGQQGAGREHDMLGR